MSAKREIATRRVAITPATRAVLLDLRKPGQTFNETISELISEHQLALLEADLDEIDTSGNTVPWEEAKKILGLHEIIG